MSKRGSDPDAAFIDAIKLHQAGMLDEAKSHYRSILDSNPKGSLFSRTVTRHRSCDARDIRPNLDIEVCMSINQRNVG